MRCRCCLRGQSTRCAGSFLEIFPAGEAARIQQGHVFYVRAREITAAVCDGGLRRLRERVADVLNTRVAREAEFGMYFQRIGHTPPLIQYFLFFGRNAVSSTRPDLTSGTVFIAWGRRPPRNKTVLDEPGISR
jgi:hypothetical protein